MQIDEIAAAMGSSGPKRTHLHHHIRKRAMLLDAIQSGPDRLSSGLASCWREKENIGWLHVGEGLK